jgi:predicted neuraminidase
MGDDLTTTTLEVTNSNESVALVANVKVYLNVIWRFCHPNMAGISGKVRAIWSNIGVSKGEDDLELPYGMYFRLVFFLMGIFINTACKYSDTENTILTPIIESGFIFPVQEEHTHGSTMVELPNGDLLAGWFQGSGERWADDVRIMGARKKRNTGTWSKPFLLADTREFPDCNPVLFIDGKDRLWLMWMTIIANQWETALLVYRISDDFMAMEGAPNWDWQENLLLKPGGRTEFGIQPDDSFVRSIKEKIEDYTTYINSDEERSKYSGPWARHAERILSLSKGDNMIREGRVLELDGRQDKSQIGYPYFRRMGWQTANKPFITATGRMIVPLYSDGFSISIMAYTDDWGETWNTGSPIVGSGNIQPAIATKKSGELVAYMRDNGPPPKRLHVSSSKDHGATWSPVRDSEIPNPGTLCDIVTLENGNWILVNNDTEEGRHRLTVSISEDEGQTWPWKRSLADESTTRSHYPAIIVGKDGLLHVSYSYFQEDGKKSIKHSMFNERWIKNINE